MNIPYDIIQPDLDVCRRWMTIVKSVVYNRIRLFIHIHKAKRVHISTKKAITGYLTIHRVKHTKKGNKGLK